MMLYRDHTKDHWLRERLIAHSVEVHEDWRGYKVTKE